MHIQSRPESLRVISWAEIGAPRMCMQSLWEVRVFAHKDFGHHPHLCFFIISADVNGQVFSPKVCAARESLTSQHIYKYKNVTTSYWLVRHTRMRTRMVIHPEAEARVTFSFYYICLAYSSG